MALAFPEWRGDGIGVAVAFWEWCFTWSVMPIPHSYSLLGSLSYRNPAVGSPVHLLHGIWVAGIFWVLQIKPYEHSQGVLCVCVCVLSIHFHFSAVALPSHGHCMWKFLISCALSDCFLQWRSHFVLPNRQQYVRAPLVHMGVCVCVAVLILASHFSINFYCLYVYKCWSSFLMLISFIFFAKVSIQNFVAGFLIEFFSYCWVWEFWTYFGYSSFIVYVIFKYFISLCRLSLHLLIVSFTEQKLSILRESASHFFFSFVNHAFDVISKNPLLIPRPQILSPETL